MLQTTVLATIATIAGSGLSVQLIVETAGASSLAEDAFARHPDEDHANVSFTRGCVLHTGGCVLHTDGGL